MITWIFNWYHADGTKSAEEVAAIMEELVLSAVGAAVAPAPREGNRVSKITTEV